SRRGTTTRWGTRRAAWTCCPTSAPRSEAVAGIAARRGARRAAGAGPCRLQRAAEEWRRDRRHAHPRRVADHQLSAGEGRARRPVVALGTAEGRARSAVLAQADRA